MSHLCDTNVWLALTLENHHHHAAAREWLDGVTDADSVMFCRATQQSFLRLLTTAAVFTPFGLAPRSNGEAWSVYDAFTGDDRVAMLADEPSELMSEWRRYSSGDAPSPKRWMDAYLAAVAKASGCTMVTTDRAFRSFDGLDALILG